jgi:thiamine kinase-like enzyme|tara:strand:- start:836 stop:1132 length:297 start_codon:yes stop_codon:yes gene_type:complete
VLKKNPSNVTPCHFDTTCENWVDDGQKMWLIGWEFSGMGGPGFDLGTVSITSEFSKSQDEEMLQAYCDGQVSDVLRARIVMYKAVCDLCWSLWGFDQW